MSDENYRKVLRIILESWFPNNIRTYIGLLNFDIETAEDDATKRDLYHKPFAVDAEIQKPVPILEYLASEDLRQTLQSQYGFDVQTLDITDERIKHWIRECNSLYQEITQTIEQSDGKSHGDVMRELLDTYNEHFQTFKIEKNYFETIERTEKKFPRQ